VPTPAPSEIAAEVAGLISEIQTLTASQNLQKMGIDQLSLQIQELGDIYLDIDTRLDAVSELIRDDPERVIDLLFLSRDMEDVGIELERLEGEIDQNRTFGFWAIAFLLGIFALVGGFPALQAVGGALFGRSPMLFIPSGSVPSTDERTQQDQTPEA
jgi:hypothetical protein